MITRRPSYSTFVEGEITVGNYNALGVSGALNSTLGENAAFSVYATKRKRDGWMDVRTGGGPRTETEDYDQNFHSLRGQLLLEPTENLDINFIADFTSREENCCTAVTTTRGATAAIIDALSPDSGVAPVADPFARVAYANRSTEQDIKDKGVSGEVNWTTPWFGGATLTSITASRDWQAINGLDFDYSSADLIYRNADENESFTGFEQFSQEFRLTGATDSVDWMVGMFYSDEDLKRNDSYRIGAAYEPYLSTLVGSRVLGGLAAQLAPFGLTVDQSNPALFLSQVTGQPFGTNFGGLGALDRYEQNAKSLALFTNNTWHATDALDLTLGLRYTREKKELDSVYSNPNGSVGCGSTLANPGGQVGAALAARIPGFQFLPPATQAALIGAVAPQVVGFMCLPWANALHNGRVTNQDREEKEWSGTLKAAYRWNEHCDDLRLGRARLQGRRLQPRPRAIGERTVEQRRGHRAGQRHFVPGRVRGQLRARRQDHVGRWQPAVERDACSTRPTRTSSSTASSAPVSWCARSPKSCRRASTPKSCGSPMRSGV